MLYLLIAFTWLAVFIGIAKRSPRRAVVASRAPV